MGKSCYKYLVVLVEAVRVWYRTVLVHAVIIIASCQIANKLMVFFLVIQKFIKEAVKVLTEAVKELVEAVRVPTY